MGAVKNRQASDHYLKQELYERVRGDSVIFEFLQDGSLDGLWYWDLEHPEHEWMNARFKALFGYEDHEMDNTPEWWQANIHPDDLATAIDNLEKHKADPNHPYDQIVRYRHRNGSTVWVRCRGLIIRDQDGKPIRMLGAHTDVTQLCELARSNSELEQFAYAASHDLQEPLRKIAGFCELLKSRYGDCLDDDGRKYVDFAVDGAHRMQALVRDILSFARIGRAGIADFRVVDGNAALRRACDALSARIAETGATINAAKLPRVRGNLNELALLFQNLLDNAIKYRSDARPAIDIAVAEEERMWHVSVADNGIGFDPKYATRILQMFQRLHPRDAYEGTGIGLSICTKVVERHGGRLWADGVDGGGATFHFTLPMLPKQPARAASAAVPAGA